MTPTSTVTPESEFILRRMQESFSDGVLLLPVAFAFVVLFLVLFFRQQETVGDLLRLARIPPLVVLVVGALWALGLVLYLGALLVLALLGMSPDAGFLLATAAPFVALPVLLGLFVAVMISVRNPRTLWAVGGVTLGCALYLLFGVLFKPTFSWWVVLLPMLAVALVYVMLMYFRDAQTVHPLWAAFLGVLRCTVYAILACVFLLPGCQTFDTTETYSKVLVLFDVSGSMERVDDVPAPGQDPRTLPSRQGKVVKMLTDPGKDNGLTFLERVQARSPATCYRFGGTLDDWELQHFVNGRKWSRDEWHAWLKPDRTKIKVPTQIGEKKLSEKEQKDLSAKLYQLYEDLGSGTNISGAALQAAVREAGSLIQAIIIVSDGQSNLGSDDTFRELRSRAGNAKRPIHIITVGVGEYRQPVSIRIDAVQAPLQARPDDKFPVRVRVFGEGLPEQPFTVQLDCARGTMKGEDWVALPGEKKALTRDGKFSAGEHPFGEVEFEIDARALRGIEAGDSSKDDEVEGTWRFTARVPRNQNESFAEAEHVSDRPALVQVKRRNLRVLLFAGGPTRDYQFVRNLFYREVLAGRMEMSIYLQSAGEQNVDQDVEAKRLLTHFPDKIGPDDPRDPYSSLSEYDVIIAFDPDWSALKNEELKLLQRWVGGPNAGGLIVVAGPVNTFQLARPGGVDLSPLLTIFPVVLKDSRLHGLGIGHDPSRPYVLNLASNAGQYDFLKIEEAEDAPLAAAWDRFFWDGEKPEPGKDARPKRGFFNYYPVEKIKPGSKVLTTFAGPMSSRINEGKDEQPYLVVMDYGAGKTVYLSSGETWRLRQYREAYHERFWVKLARYAGGGNLSKLSKYGMILAPQKASTGLVPIEAQILGDNLLPLPRDARPTVVVTPPKTFDDKADRDTPLTFELKAKSTQGDWNGWFAGNFKVRTDGEYTLKIEIPRTSQVLTHRLTIERPNPERDNIRPDFGHLYQLATDARPILTRFDEKKRSEYMRVLKAPVGEEDKEAGNGGKEQVRLFFPLESAQLIPDMLINVPPNRESTKGRLQDLWDQGWDSGLALQADILIAVIVGVVGLLACGILLFIRRPVFALLVLGATVLSLALLGGVDWYFAPPWADLPLNMSFVLGVVVGLLSIEWLTRKLLKLA